MSQEVPAIEPAAPAAIVPLSFEEQTLAVFEKDFAPKLLEKLQFYTQVAAITGAVKVADAASLEVADKWNKELLREKDALEEVRASGPGALNRLGRKMGARFKPLFDILEAQSSNLKREMGVYLLAERKKQEQTYQAAAVAHMAGDHAAAQVSLAIASSADTSAPHGNSLKEVWQVERYELGLMVLSTPEHPGLIPDEEKISAYLRTLPAGEEPCLPGVICKLVPAMTTRR